MTSKASRIECIKIDLSQPGASEMIKVIERYNSSAIAKKKDHRGKISLAVELKKAPRHKGIISKTIKDLSLGDNSQEQRSAVISHSCAVTIK